MNNIKEVFSSGGVGDTLIVGLKIRQSMKNFPETEFTWRHFERHQCHADPCMNIMGMFVQKREIYVMDGPEKAAKEMCHDVNGTYLDTVIKGYPNPYLDKPLGDGSFLLGRSDTFDLKDHIVIQMHAGRMHDNTRREVGREVIQQLKDEFWLRKIVLIGPESYEYKDDQVVNLTGQTPNVVDSLELINDCSLFVGHDGIAAYYAMMMKKLVIVSFHIPTLVNHYWNLNWANHALCLQGSGTFLRKLPDHEKVKLLFKLAKLEADSNNKDRKIR